MPIPLFFHDDINLAKMVADGIIINKELTFILMTEDDV